MNDLAIAKKAIRNARTPADIYALLFEWRGPEEKLIEEIAASARVWDLALIHLVTTSDLATIDAFLHNWHRPKGAEDILLRWAVGRLVGEADEKALRNAGMVLNSLIEKQHVPLGHPAIRELWDVLQPKKQRLKLTTREEIILEALLDHPDLDAERLLELFRMIECSSGVDSSFMKILGHRNTPPEIWRRLVEIKRPPLSRDLLNACIRRDEIRQDPAVRERLISDALRLGRRSYMYDFVRDANPADCAELFRKLPENGPFRAENMLVRHGQEIAPYLTMDDVNPFLSSPRQEVRLAAITCLGQIQNGKPQQHERSAKRT